MDPSKVLEGAYKVCSTKYFQGSFCNLIYIINLLSIKRKKLINAEIPVLSVSGQIMNCELVKHNY